MLRRRSVVWLACVLILGAGLAGWWAYHTSRPGYRFRQGQQAIVAGDLNAAERAAAALERAGSVDEARLLRAEALVCRGEQHHSGDELLAAVALLNQVSPDSGYGVDAACLIGRCMLGVGQLVEAERAFAFVLSQNPDCVDAHRGLMAVYYDLGALNEARGHAEKWGELAPRDGRPHRFLGLLYKDMGQWRQALAPYRAAQERDLKDAVHEEVRIELAECLIHVGECSEALNVLEPSRPTVAQLATVRTLQAECHRQLGDARPAADLLAQALDAVPTHTPALRLRAQISLDADEPAKAVVDLQRAAAIAPHEYETHHLLARTYSGIGQAEKSRAADARVHEIQAQRDALTKLTLAAIERPRDATLHLKMAILFEQLGMPERAAGRRRVAALLTGPAPSGAMPLDAP
jgi:tetratricopeptide (TPR) repeat protein